MICNVQDTVKQYHNYRLYVNQKVNTQSAKGSAGANKATYKFQNIKSQKTAKSQIQEQYFLKSQNDEVAFYYVIWGKLLTVPTIL